MRLSDIKGEAALVIVADMMELVEMVADDERFEAFVGDIRSLGGDADGAWRVVCRRIPPLLREKRYRDRVMSILAACKGVPAEEYARDGDVLRDLFELVTSDSEAIGFLAQQQEAAK